MAIRPPTRKERRIVTRAGRRHHLNPALLWGLDYAESGHGENTGPSSAGAIGRLQFMPETARGYGIDPNNFRQAVNAAAQYLETYKGRGREGMLRAYNAGPAGGPNPESAQHFQHVLEGMKQWTGSRDAGDSPGSSSTSSSFRPWSVKIGEQTSFDQAGFEQAKKLAIVGQLLAKHHGTGGVLFKTGVLSTEQPDPSDFLKTVLDSKVVKGPRETIPGVKSVGGGGSKLAYGPSGGKGLGGLVGKPIDRPGVSTSPRVLKAVKRISNILGSPITLGTGTAHDKMTVSGNVSDHWSGNAVDLPASGKRLYAMGRSALIAAGMDPKKARKAPGGLYNINGWQIIFATTEGGDHWDHVHVHPA